MFRHKEALWLLRNRRLQWLGKIGIDDRDEFELGLFRFEYPRDERGDFGHWRNGRPFISNPLELWELDPQIQFSRKIDVAGEWGIKYLSRRYRLE